MFQSRQQQHSKSCSHHQITNNSSHPPVTVPVTTKAAATPNSGHSSSHTKLQSQITKMSRTCKKLGASTTIQIATILYQVTEYEDVYLSTAKSRRSGLMSDLTLSKCYHLPNEVLSICCCLLQVVNLLSLFLSFCL